MQHANNINMLINNLFSMYDHITRYILTRYILNRLL